MKTLVDVLAAVQVMAGVSAPAVAVQPTKGIKMPDIRRSEPTDAQRPEIRPQANSQAAPVFKPMRFKGLDIR